MAGNGYANRYGLPRLESVLQDVCFGLRMLRKNPGFTAVAVLTLALGIGATTAIFSMVNGIMLRALPYAQPDRLYSIHEFVPQFSTYGPSLPVNGGNFLAWKKESRAFSAMALIDPESASLLGMGHPQWLYGVGVTPELFSILGVQPLTGRFFVSEDGAPAKPEIILTNKLWREQFHSNPDILGVTVRLNDRALTVVGVLPANFVFPRILTHDPQYLVPFPWEQWNSRPGIGTHNYFAVARLKPGVTPRQAKAQLDSIESGIAQTDADSQFNLYAIVTPLKLQIVGPVRGVLWMLTMAAGLVLLIVCANLANLLLAKNGERTREIALRCTFGAGRWRLVRQFMIETFLLAFAGAFLGLLLAKVSLWLLIRSAPAGIPRVDEIRLDSTALWFNFGVTILALLIFGLLPSLRATQVELSERLKSSAPAMSASKESASLRAVLVIGEVTLCAALLPVCLLLVKSLRHVVLANQWMNDDHVIATDLFVPISVGNEFRASTERNRIFDSIEAKVRQLPGMEAAGFTSTLPLQGVGWGDSINFQEIPVADAQQLVGEFRFASPGYFAAVGLSLVKGRFFTDADRGQPVALISERVGQALLGGRDAVGMHLECRDLKDQKRQWCRIVGEVADARDESDQSPILVAYFPLWIYAETSESLVIRTRMDPTSAAGSIREAIWSAEPDLGIPQIKTLSTIVATAEAPRRYETFLIALFASCAVLLAMLGLYAVISYSVGKRNHEMGVRIALGAQQRDVLWMIVREAMTLAGTGIVIGIGAGLALAQLLRDLLFEIQPGDPATFVAVALVLSLVALAACYMPARRAMRVDPIVTLRHE